MKGELKFTETAMKYEILSRFLILLTPLLEMLFSK